MSDKDFNFTIKRRDIITVGLGVIIGTSISGSGWLAAAGGLFYFLPVAFVLIFVLWMIFGFIDDLF